MGYKASTLVHAARSEYFLELEFQLCGNFGYFPPGSGKTLDSTPKNCENPIFSAITVLSELRPHSTVKETPRTSSSVRSCKVVMDVPDSI